ncbi:uncharacterized protein N7487_000138 [Penicillium crustosum]|uniref:uncharacterized protein n=1 Tax=Penicillium crustosum TaxID=36656 RepID=UPI0023987829|nr:uncharacterized protein N7487_000138 [Penicillium crustosum]KAJ5416588.1 hypothetical protein N7487_000138 [Penicillium crustosum]
MGQVMDIFDIRCTHHTLKITDSMPGWALANKIHKMILDYLRGDSTSKSFGALVNTLVTIQMVIT